MPNEFIKAERVVRTQVGLLERELILPNLVWREGFGDFRGAKGDTITIRLPAYSVARTRVLRSGDPIVLGSRIESSVDLKLDTHVYDAVPITDEELTLDIVDFGAQVLQPGVRAVARGIEDAVATEIASATYAPEHQVTIDPDEPHRAFARARRLLNDANVPMDMRVCVCGSGVEEAILNAENIVRADASGSDSALVDATFARLRGFRLVVSNAIDPDKAYAFHQTAFALALVAPAIPDGASWGDTVAISGFAIRALRDYDFMNVRDRLLTDVFVGTGTVEDLGEFDADGKWQPWDGEGHEPDGILARAVELTLAAS